MPIVQSGCTTTQARVCCTAPQASGTPHGFQSPWRLEGGPGLHSAGLFIDGYDTVGLGRYMGARPFAPRHATLADEPPSRATSAVGSVALRRGREAAALLLFATAIFLIFSL